MAGRNGVRAGARCELDAVGISTADLNADIQAAQAELVQAGQAPSIKRDPSLRLFLATQARVIGVLGSAVEHMRQPLADADLILIEMAVSRSMTTIGAEISAGVEKGAHSATRMEAARLIRSLDRSLAIRVSLAIGAAFVCGVIVTAAVLRTAEIGPYSPDAQAAGVWADLHRCNAFPQKAKTVQNGNNRAVVTLWATCDQQPGDAR